MAQWIEVLAAKSNDLNSIPKTYMREEKTPHTVLRFCIWVYVRTHIQ